MKEALSSSEKTVLTTDTRRNIPEGTILHNRRRENLKSYIEGKVFLRSVRRLLVTASVDLSTPILVTLMKEAISPSEEPVLTTATRRNNPEDTIFLITFTANLLSKGLQ
jgi:hypothetical protein